MKVTPIIAPAVDWQAFITEVHTTLGRSPASSLTIAGLKPGTLKTIAPALGEFQHEGTPAIPFLKSKDSDQVLGHLWVSFLVEAERATIGRLLCLARLNPLTPDDSDTLAILSGSLREWRDLVITMSRLKSPPDVRAVVTEVYIRLVRAGLGDLFADCETKRHADGSIILEQKRGR